MIFFFWFFFFLITYHYFIFPIITFVFAFVRNKKVVTNDIFPNATLIIAAYNEEKIIEDKIKNSFELEYPKDKLEIIIVSDGSTDTTPDIVNTYQDHGVIGLFQPPRQGKTAALNRAVERARGDIVVFSDANSMYDPMSIKLLVRNFADPSVGGVCGRKSIIENVERESSRGDSLFWDLESTIKIQQSKIGSITTGDGEIFAVRRNLYSHIPEEVINDDTAITFNIVQAGYRIVYEPGAITREEASIVLEDDFKVKARMVSGGYQTLAMYADMLFPPKNFFALQFISHKILRWIMPILLAFLFISNLFILHGLYFIFFLLQVSFYTSALVGYLKKKLHRDVGVLYMPLYYCSMNLAALLGLYYFLRREAVVNIWKKAER